MLNLLQMGRAAARVQRAASLDGAVRNTGSGDALKIWNQVQAIMRGTRIICTPRGLLLVEESGGSAAALRRQQVVESVDHGIERGQHPLAVGASGCDLPQHH